MKKWATRDLCIKVLTKCGTARVIIASVGLTASRALSLVNDEDRDLVSSRVATEFANTLTFSVLNSSLLSGEERSHVTFHGNMIYRAESLALGETRARLLKSVSGTPKGLLTVQRILYNKAQPVSSSTIGNDDVSEAARHHYLQSDGLRTAVFLKSHAREDRSIEYATGVLFQPIVSNSAECCADELNNHFREWETSEKVHTLLAEASVHGSCIATLLKSLSGDGFVNEAATKMRFPNVVPYENFPSPIALSLQLEGSERTPIDYFCRCNKRDFVGAMRSVGRDELLKLRKEHERMPLKCQFCRREFTMESVDWDSVLT